MPWTPLNRTRKNQITLARVGGRGPVTVLEVGTLYRASTQWLNSGYDAEFILVSSAVFDPYRAEKFPPDGRRAKVIYSAAVGFTNGYSHDFTLDQTMLKQFGNHPRNVWLGFIASNLGGRRGTAPRGIRFGLLLPVAGQ